MLSLVSLALKSRTVCAVLAVLAVGLALYGWHRLDKGSAVRRAVSGYVADVELAAARAALAKARLTAAAAQKANQHLADEIAQAEARTQAANLELESYVSTVDDDCRVDDGLAGRLPNR